MATVRGLSLMCWFKLASGCRFIPVSMRGFLIQQPMPPGIKPLALRLTGEARLAADIAAKSPSRHGANITNLRDASQTITLFARIHSAHFLRLAVSRSNCSKLPPRGQSVIPKACSAHPASMTYSPVARPEEWLKQVLHRRTYPSFSGT
ncbi:hypothetical protein KCP69_04225 [Salmonella enterica subsp. enterica]|nr:hypothetical protein KCP69_04225 [Salmonella enterica subsp. enterica]